MPCKKPIGLPKIKRQNVASTRLHSVVNISLLNLIQNKEYQLFKNYTTVTPIIVSGKMLVVSCHLLIKKSGTKNCKPGTKKLTTNNFCLKTDYLSLINLRPSDGFNNYHPVGTPAAINS